MASREKAQALIRRGVGIPDPGAVSIGEEVDPERIAESTRRFIYEGVLEQI